MGLLLQKIISYYLIHHPQTYSNYKGGPTSKYLIGITVHGYICYISDGYGGRVTDQYITEDCGTSDNLIMQKMKGWRIAIFIWMDSV